MRFLWLIVPTTALERALLPRAGYVYREAPKSPFESITLADERETGLFVRPCLPRMVS